MTPLLIRLLILVAIFASVFLISQLVGRLILNRQAERTAVNRRLSMLRSGIDRETVAGTLLKNAPPMLSPEAGLPERARVGLIRMVMMTALPIEARQLSLTMGIGFCVIVAILLLLAWSAEFSLSLGVVLLVTVIAGAIAVGIPLMIISRMAQSRRKKMEEQFPLSLDIFTRSLRVGHPIASAIHLIGSEFGLVHDEVAYGAELTDALAAMAERWDLEDMRMFVVSVSVQSETGGNLAEILENLSQVIRARAAMYMKVRALSSEGRMTAWMLTALPVITLVSLFIVNPGFYFDVAQDPIFLIGFPSLILLYVTGVLIIRRMVDLKV
jgi:tight adherence protein B